VTASPSSLPQISEELAAREPIFHRAEFGTSRSEFETMLADDFFEVGRAR
jgi:hypothetical protein